MLFTGEIYFWLPRNIVSSDWSIVVSKASSHVMFNKYH